MSTTSYEPSENEHGDQPLNVADYPDIHRFTFGQMRTLKSHLLEFPVLSREDRPEFLQKRFEEVWIFENPSWDWDGRPPKKDDNPKYHWTKQASHYPYSVIISYMVVVILHSRPLTDEFI
jgi:hypothetical protein